MKKTSNRKIQTAIAAFLAAMSASCAEIFVGSDTYVVTNAATAAIRPNAPVAAGADIPWHPAGILANFRDSPTGTVLKVSHIRAGICNPLVSTNAIAVTNILFTATNAADAAVWNPAGIYSILPDTDQLLIETSSTNAEIIVNKHILR